MRRIIIYLLISFSFAPFSFCWSAPLDFDGDGLTDVAGIRNQDDGSANELEVNYYPSASGVVKRKEFGKSAEAAVYADYDGDSITDQAVVGISDGQLLWRIKLSSLDGQLQTSLFGTSASVLVISGCDFDGDGKSDKSYIESKSSLFFEKSSNSESASISTGLSNLQRFYCADLDADSISEFIAQKEDDEGNSVFYVYDAISGENILERQFGQNVEQILAADIDGNGSPELGYARRLSAGMRKLVFLQGDTEVEYEVATNTLVNIAKYKSSDGEAEGVLVKTKGKGNFLLYPSFSSDFVPQTFSLGTAEEVLPSVNVSKVGPLVSEEALCTESNDPTDGNEGFLWKPVSDSTGAAVLLLPRGTRLKKVRIIKDGKVLEKLYYGGVGNGARTHWRSRKRASSFPSEITVIGKARDGSNQCWLIVKPRKRYD